MKFKIHFEINEEHSDYFIVEADTIEEIKAIVSDEESKRGLSQEKNNMWSEEV